MLCILSTLDQLLSTVRCGTETNNKNGQRRENVKAGSVTYFDCCTLSPNLCVHLHICLSSLLPERPVQVYIWCVVSLLILIEDKILSISYKAVLLSLISYSSISQQEFFSNGINFSSFPHFSSFPPFSHPPLIHPVSVMIPCTLSV